MSDHALVPTICCKTLPWPARSVARPWPVTPKSVARTYPGLQNRLPDLALAPRITCQTSPWHANSVARPCPDGYNRLSDIALAPRVGQPSPRTRERGSDGRSSSVYQHQEEKAMALAIKIRRPNVTVASEELCLRSNVGSLPPRAREGNGSTDQTSLVYNHQDKSNGSGESSSPGREGSRAWTRVLRCVVLVSMGGR